MRVLYALLALFAIAQAVEIGVAHLKGTGVDSNIVGNVYFVQMNSSYVLVVPSISGVTVNTNANHGLHVHQFGDLRSQADGLSVGSHYVGAGNSSHFCEDTSPRHEGDMGNWMVASDGTLSGQMKTLDLLTLDGMNSIIGKAVVLHANPDDCVTVSSSGSRLAFGVIGIANYNILPDNIISQLPGSASNNTAISADTTVLKAIAVLAPTSANQTYTNVTGYVSFSQDASTGYVTVTAMITGLKSTQGYGFHIHLFGDWSVNGTAAAGHFNTTASQSHSAPPSTTRHAGDLGNICTYDANGNAYYQYTITDGAISLTDPSKNILGRNIIVHANYDTAMATTVFGDRIAQGVIGVFNSSSSDFVTIPTGLSVQAPACSSFAPVGPTNTTTGTPSPVSSTTRTSSPVASTTGTSATSSSSFVSISVSALFLVLLAVLLF